MAQLYECVLLMSPTLNEEGVKGYEEQFSSLITEAKGEIVQVQPWGKRRLAYPIAKRTEAFYTLIVFSMEEGAGAVIVEFERQVRINEDLLREMTIKVDSLRKMDPPSRDIVLGSRGPRPIGRPVGRPGAPREFRPATASTEDEVETSDTDSDNNEAPAETLPTQESVPAPAETPASEQDTPPADTPPASEQDKPPVPSE